MDSDTNTFIYTMSDYREQEEEEFAYEPTNYDEFEKDFLISIRPYTYSDETQIKSFVDWLKYPNIYERLDLLTVQDVRQLSIRQLRNVLRIEPPDELWNESTQKQVDLLDEELAPFVEEYLEPLLRRPVMCELIHDEYFGSSNEPLPAIAIRCLRWVCEEHLEHDKKRCVKCGATICMECGGAYSQYCETDDAGNDQWHIKCQKCTSEDHAVMVLPVSPSQYTNVGMPFR